VDRTNTEGKGNRLGIADFKKSMLNFLPWGTESVNPQARYGPLVQKKSEEKLGPRKKGKGSIRVIRGKKRGQVLARRVPQAAILKKGHIKQDSQGRGRRVTTG